MLDHDQLAIPGFDDHPVVMADPSCQALTRSASADEQSVANQAPILIPAHPFNTRQFGAYELLGYQLGKKLDKAVGNLVNIYDFLPRFMWSGRTVKAVAQFTQVKEGTIHGEPFRITFSAVHVRRKVESPALGEPAFEDVGVFPGYREELVEDALRRFSVIGKAVMTDQGCKVSFTLYELMKELKLQHHTYSLTEIREALTILNKSNVEIVTNYMGEIITTSTSYIPEIIYSTARGKRKDGDAKCVATLHSLISRSIERQDFRLFDYSTRMQLKNPLAIFLFKRLSYHWRNAAPDAPFKLNLIEFLDTSNAGKSDLMADKLRAMKMALKQLVDKRVLSGFESKAIPKPVGRGAMDHAFLLFPTNEFVTTIIKGHSKEAKESILIRRRPGSSTLI